jgi:hypothetical protein
LFIDGLAVRGELNRQDYCDSNREKEISKQQSKHFHVANDLLRTFRFAESAKGIDQNDPGCIKGGRKNKR